MIRALKKILNKRKTRLPQGVTEFNIWANDILDTYELPNNDSTHFALATAVMHSKNGEAYHSKDFFANVLLKGAANQVAYAVMNDCKIRQEAKAKEEAAAQAQSVEDTTSTQDVASSDVSKLQ